MGHLDRHDLCNTGLGLGLGFPATAVVSVAVKKPCGSKRGLEPSLTLGLYGSGGGSDDDDSYYRKIDVNKDYSCELSPQSAVSNSMSNASVKREEEVEIERVICSRVSDPEDDLDGLNARKKLRLTKDQSALLEESFKLHSTLNPKQKQALANELSLKPRQVEVWFQNRRARTKLKQTEVDCEFLKKCCETLTDENRRLQKELQELKALKVAQPFYMQLPAATLTMCPSCERIGAGSAIAGDNSTKTQFTMAHPKPHHFYNPFNNPSAAC